MRTKVITDCFEIGWLLGFSITISIIQCWCVPITDTGTAAGPLRTAAGWEVLFQGEADPGTTTPRGWRKNRGRVPGPGRLYFSAIQNHLLKTGVVQEKQGGHDF